MFINILMPGKIGCQFADNILQCIFLMANIFFWLIFHIYGSIDSNTALFQVLAWFK